MAKQNNDYIYPDFIPGTNTPIIDLLGVISKNPFNGTVKELNLIEVPSVLDDSVTEPKFDIREYTKDHSRCSAGILLDETEAQELVDILYDLDIVPTQIKRFLNEYDGYPREYEAVEDDETETVEATDDTIPGQISLFE